MSWFQPSAALPDRCGSHCPAKDNCPYYIGNDSMSNFPGEGKVEPLCVYNAGGDVVDHQSVHIQYENGIVCNFLMNFNAGGDRSGRNLHIVGTRGRLWGNEAELAVMTHDMATDQVTRHPFERENTAHSGGNRIHAEEFLRLVAGETTSPVAGVYDAYLSAMLCFAADRARLERRLVGIRYPLEKEMELV
ncbi:MAG: hypothetical protein LC725_04775 [Lentisphaerae bacterium]|nr:hypothetical protein [Lentisphaerota bacterium]